jgi:hypothetical protein
MSSSGKEAPQHVLWALEHVRRSFIDQECESTASTPRTKHRQPPYGLAVYFSTILSVYFATTFSVFCYTIPKSQVNTC